MPVRWITHPSTYQFYCILSSRSVKLLTTFLLFWPDSVTNNTLHTTTTNPLHYSESLPRRLKLSLPIKKGSSACVQSMASKVVAIHLGWGSARIPILFMDVSTVSLMTVETLPVTRACFVPSTTSLETGYRGMYK